jgi:opacity protein-like surface antigen
MRSQLLLYGFFLLTGSQLAKAQDSSLLSKLNDSMAVGGQKIYVTGTFKATHIVNMQTVEGPAKRAMIFLIQHRFGTINSGSYNFFGLDNATLRLALDYGLCDRLTVGVGRSSYLKTYDGYLKYKLLRQTDGSEAMPVTMSILGAINYYTVNIPGESYINNMYRTSYATQLLIARKFNRNLSLQITPTWLHYNLMATSVDKNDVFGLGMGGRMKITRRMSIDAEYDYLPSGQIQSGPVQNSFSLGWDIETGGHVFQLVFSNSQSMVESQYFGQTTGKWSNGDIYFGFNLSRVFDLKKKPAKKDSL